MITNGRKRGMKATGYIGLLVISFVVCGCDNENRSLWEQLKQADSDKTTLNIELDRLLRENQRLGEQVQALTAIDPNLRIAELETLDKIALGRLTGVQDKDGDGRADSLVVYLEPVDTAQDRIKAVGKLHVQLWNLSAPQGQNALLAEWDLAPPQLQRCWASTFLTNFYHIDLPLPAELIGAGGEFTVGAEFTDYLSGRVCRTQRAIISR